MGSYLAPLVASRRVWRTKSDGPMRIDPIGRGDIRLGGPGMTDASIARMGGSIGGVVSHLCALCVSVVKGGVDDE